jgi:hypothetical protein
MIDFSGFALGMAGVLVLNFILGCAVLFNGSVGESSNHKFELVPPLRPIPRWGAWVILLTCVAVLTVFH